MNGWFVQTPAKSLQMILLFKLFNGFQSVCWKTSAAVLYWYNNILHHIVRGQVSIAQLYLMNKYRQWWRSSCCRRVVVPWAKKISYLNVDFWNNPQQQDPGLSLTPISRTKPRKQDWFMVRQRFHYLYRKKHTWQHTCVWVAVFVEMTGL